MTRPLAVMRCDASASIGAGHVMRCLAVAEGLASSGYPVVFASRAGTPQTVPLVADRFEMIELKQDAAAEAMELTRAIPDGCDILVVDHYQRDAGFETACRDWARSIVVFDDGTGRSHDCDVLIDAAASSRQSYDGKISPHAAALTGAGAALLRRDFIVNRPGALARRDGRSVCKILVAIGATDPLNLTPCVLDVIASAAPEVSVTIALSSQAPHLDALRKRAGERVRLVLDAPSMAELISEADLAVGAAGTSAYERAYLGLPSIMVTVAENQRGVSALMTREGAAIDSGSPEGGWSEQFRGILDALLKDSDARLRMSNAAMALIDGRGVWRLLALLAGAVEAGASSVRLRLAESSDESWLLDLQRQLSTRKFARDNAIPTAEGHVAWMAKTLTDDRRVLAIVEQEGRPAGMVRLDRRSEAPATYEVSIAIDEALQRRGLGLSALRLARRLVPAADLLATVLPQNTASLKLFAAAGFRADGSDRFRSRAA